MQGHYNLATVKIPTITRKRADNSLSKRSNGFSSNLRLLFGSSLRNGKQLKARLTNLDFDRSFAGGISTKMRKTSGCLLTSDEEKIREVVALGIAVPKAMGGSRGKKWAGQTEYWLQSGWLDIILFCFWRISFASQKSIDKCLPILNIQPELILNDFFSVKGSDNLYIAMEKMIYRLLVADNKEKKKGNLLLLKIAVHLQNEFKEDTVTNRCASELHKSLGAVRIQYKQKAKKLHAERKRTQQLIQKLTVEVRNAKSVDSDDSEGLTATSADELENVVNLGAPDRTNPNDSVDPALYSHNHPRFPMHPQPHVPPHYQQQMGYGHYAQRFHPYENHYQY